ncbi:MAG: hypothetical protein IJV00_00485 [Clostridia bacterium]|nr:hypothetical protein [Clostridia bacterium]
MKKTPISLIIDDPAPVLSVYFTHASRDTTADGRKLMEYYPNELLFRFCDVIERWGIKGKFSVVPMPGNRGDIINGIEGVTKRDLDEWMDTVKKRVEGPFSIGPEMLTHNLAVDLVTGEALGMDEQKWASTKDRKILTEYIARALSILKEAGFDPVGVTSPWTFGIEVEDEYQAAISAAVERVSGSKKAWFFLRGRRGVPDAKPWVALEEDGRTLVSIPATLHDHFWRTIDEPRTDDAFVSYLADKILTEDGKGGKFVEVLETGGFPILISHWQSLMSNGLATGLRALDETARRIAKNFSDRVEWMSFCEILDLVIADKASFPKPVF